MSTKTRLKSASEVLEKYVGPVNFAMFMRVSRRDLELTQTQMAKKLKIAPGTLCDIEKGRQLVSVTLAAKIATMAGLSVRLAVQLALQDQINKAKLDYKINLIA